MVHGTSVNARIFLPAVFDEFFTRFWAAILFRVILILIFLSFVFYLKDINEDALGLAIAPSASVSALGRRKLSDYTYPPPLPVFLSPPLFPELSLSHLLSLAPVLLSSSSLLSELSDKSDDDGLPLFPNEDPSSLSLAS